MRNPVIRIAAPDDAASLLAIYKPYVESTSVTFENKVPGLLEFQERIISTVEINPWLLCSLNEKTVGYALASIYKSRSAYRWTIEVSVYVDRNLHRHGIGSALYYSLIETLKMQGYRTALACIALPNPVSVDFHEAFGFSLVGVIKNAGYKLGEWHNSGWYQLDLHPAGSKKSPIPPRRISDITLKPEWKEILQRGKNLLH